MPEVTLSWNLFSVHRMETMTRTRVSNHVTTELGSLCFFLEFTFLWNYKKYIGSKYEEKISLLRKLRIITNSKKMKITDRISSFRSLDSSEGTVTGLHTRQQRVCVAILDRRKILPFLWRVYSAIQRVALPLASTIKRSAVFTAIPMCPESESNHFSSLNCSYYEFKARAAYVSSARRKAIPSFLPTPSWYT